MMMRAALILAGIGILVVMEIQTSPRTKNAVSEPPALSIPALSRSDGALPKGDRLEISSAEPVQPVSFVGIIPPNEIAVVSKQAPHIGNQPRRVVQEKKGVVLRAKPRLKRPKPKLVAKTESSKVSIETKLCLTNAFDGLLKALNVPNGCET